MAINLPPNAEDLSPEDLAVWLLKDVTRECASGHPHAFNFRNYTNSLGRGPLSIAVAEAWAWLIREGLVVPAPATDVAWYVPSRRGKTLKTRDDMIAHRQASLLPRAQLHPLIAKKVAGLFYNGDYDTAVFATLKEVEVAVRTAGGLPDELIGVDLMRQAFHPTTGPLTVATEVKGERDALGHLFAGAFGRYRNAAGHRRVNLPAEEAVEVIVLASLLMRIVEGRAPTPP